MKKKAIIFLLIAGLQTGVSYAGFSDDDAGTATAQFLKLGAGARATAMGEAYGAVADDATAIYWNPAGIAQLKQTSMSLMHAEWVEDIFYDWGSVAVPLGDKGSLGVGIQYLSYGDIKEIDESGIEKDNFCPTDLAASIAYAVSLKGTLVGINAKYISSEIKEKATAVAADIGVMQKLMANKLSLGMAVQNLGSKMKFIDEKEELPLNIKMGAAYRLTDRILCALDVNAPKDNEINAGVGTEYTQKLGENLSVAGRIGYSTRTKNIEGLNGLSAGIGGNISGYMLDYSYVPFGDIGNTHRISISIKFN